MPPVIGLSYMALKVNAKMCKVMYVQVASAAFFIAQLSCILD